jgi:acetyl esterase
MDPQVQEFLALANASPQPPIDTIPVVVARRMFANAKMLFQPMVEVGRVEEWSLANGVRLRVYHPPGGGDTARPGILYFHGGGWVLGDLETHDTLCRQFAISASAVVIAVDYRLAPEHPFPAAFDDAWESLRHVRSHANELGVDPRRIAVAGDSAGGNLAAAMALKARDTGQEAIAFQCLLYPVMDCGCDTPSYHEFAEGYGLTRARMRFFWKSYLGEREGDDPFLSPLRASSLRGLPPALVVTAGCDVLRDEGEAFSNRLRADGVSVESMRIDGVIHGFIHYGGFISKGQEVLNAVGKKVGDALRGQGVDRR